MYVCVWCNKVYFPNTNPQCDPLAHLGFWVAKYSTTQDVTNIDMRSMHVIIGGNMKFLDVIRTFWVINFQAFKRKQILVREHKQEESNNKVGHVSKQSSQYAVMYNFFFKKVLCCKQLKVGWWSWTTLVMGKWRWNALPPTSECTSRNNTHGSKANAIVQQFVLYSLTIDSRGMDS